MQYLRYGTEALTLTLLQLSDVMKTPCGISNTGYQGFQGRSVKPPPPMKPGETEISRKTKFCDVGEAAKNKIFPDKQYLTVSSTMSIGLSSSDYHAPDKRGVSASFTSTSLQNSRRSCTALTLNRQSYLSDVENISGFAAKASSPERLLNKTSNSEIARRTNSTYEMDLGIAGESPSLRPYVVRTGMASTTMDLNEGTTKATYHIPGYGGHIPCSIRNPTMRQHSEGSTARPLLSNSSLYRHNLPGYTGHKPSSARNDKGPQFSGGITVGEVL